MPNTPNDTGSEIVIANEKPLNQTQAKNLREIIAMDFRDLEAEVKLSVDKQLNARLKTIAAQYGTDAELEEATREVHAMLASFRAQAEEARQRWAEKNIRASSTIGNGTPLWSLAANPSCLVRSGHTEAKARAHDAATRLKQMAIATINRNKSIAERSILLQTLSGAAASELLSDVPTVGELMDMVMERLGTEGMDEIQELMGSIPDQPEPERKALDV